MIRRGKAPGPGSDRGRTTRDADAHLDAVAVAGDAKPHAHRYCVAYNRAVANRNGIPDRNRNTGGIADRYGHCHAHEHGNRHADGDRRANGVAHQHAHADRDDCAAGG